MRKLKAGPPQVISAAHLRDGAGVIVKALVATGATPEVDAALRGTVSPLAAVTPVVITPLPAVKQAVPTGNPFAADLQEMKPSSELMTQLRRINLSKNQSEARNTNHDENFNCSFKYGHAQQQQEIIDVVHVERVSRLVYNL